MAVAAATLAGVLSALQLSRTTSSSIYFRRSYRGLYPRVQSSVSSPPTERFKASKAPSKSESRSGNHASSSSSRSAPGDESSSVSRGRRSSRNRAESPPARFVHTMTDAETRMKRREKNMEIASGEKSAEAPKYSKAAWRFYNERFREPPQRLSKVLAASGGII